MLSMPWFLDIIYALGLFLYSPILLVISLFTGKYRRDLGGRMGRISPETLAVLVQQPAGNRRLLIHCVSVGELRSVTTLVEQLLNLVPDLTVIVSNTTDTGAQQAKTLYASRSDSRVLAVRYPLDFSSFVNRFFDTLKPDMIVLVELETWPNFLFAAARRHIPVWIVNGRMTEKSYRRYRLIRPLMAAMLGQIESIGLQTETIVRRFVALGAKSENVVIIPSLKYDAADFVDHLSGSEAMYTALGLTEEHQLFVGGSIGPGEEERLLSAYQELQEQWPTLRLALAPRKPEVVRRVIKAIKNRNLVPVLRTQCPDDPNGKPRSALESNEIVVLDTMGELRKLYSIAYAVFSGRSLINKGGSDMIEVAALAKPCCFGPYTYNFSEPVELLLSKNAATCIFKQQQLVGRIQAWLAAPDRAAAMGRRAREVLKTQRGATQRYARRIAERLQQISRD